MTKTIPCSRWKYVGMGGGKGQIHSVLDIDAAGWITTSTQFLSREVQHSWRGPAELFYLEFVPVVPQGYDGGLDGVVVVPD